MTDIGRIQEFCISRGAPLLADSVTVAATTVHISRHPPGNAGARQRLEMVSRTPFNFFFLLLMLAFLYQAARIANVHKVLVERNAPFCEGGQVLAPVADENEINSMRSLSIRAATLGVVALLLSAIGWRLQLRKMARYGLHRTPHSGPQPRTDNRMSGLRSV